MPRTRRYNRRPPPRRRDYDDYDDYSYPRRRRRGGCFAPIRRFFRGVVIVFLTAIGAIVFFLVVLLIAFHFALFIQIMYYVLLVAAFLAVLGVVYLVVRLITAISHRISSAKAAKAEAKAKAERARIEQERVAQVRIQVRAQEAKLYREERLFNQKYVREAEKDYYQSARRTRNFREEPGYEESEYEDQPPVRRATRNFRQESPYRTRNFQEQGEPNDQMRALPETRSQESAAIPHISQLIGRSILFGQEDMLYGFEVENGSLVEVRSGWPGTAIIAGKSGSGKTRRVIVMVFQAILAGQKITICDPHAYKPDGLIKVLAPFAPWLRFARSDDEIIAAAKEHITEFKSRLSPTGSIHGEGLTPRLIIFDEFPAIMTNEDISVEDKRMIAECVRKSATQYRGVFGSAWIIGQEFTEDALGDTAIRKDAHAILCHQLSDEYVKFLFPRDLKTQRLIQQIERRECVYKDNDNHTKRISTPTVTDDEIPDMVAYLKQMLPQASQPGVGTTMRSRRETEPVPPRPSSRQFGAPARQEKLVLHRTNLVEDQAEPQPIPLPAIKTQRRQTASLSPRPPAASAIWGDTTQPVFPSKPLPPVTDELAPRPQLQQTQTSSLDALAALRDQAQQQRKKKER